MKLAKAIAEIVLEHLVAKVRAALLPDFTHINHKLDRIMSNEQDLDSNIATLKAQLTDFGTNLDNGLTAIKAKLDKLVLANPDLSDEISDIQGLTSTLQGANQKITDFVAALPPDPGTTPPAP